MESPKYRSEIIQHYENVPYSKTMFISLLSIILLCIIRVFNESTSFIHLISCMSLFIAILYLGALISDEIRKVQHHTQRNIQNFSVVFVLVGFVIIGAIMYGYLSEDLNKNYPTLRSYISDVSTIFSFFIALFQNTLSKWIAMIATS